MCGELENDDLEIFKGAKVEVNDIPEFEFKQERVACVPGNSIDDLFKHPAA